jgi:hypothetical protein
LPYNGARLFDQAQVSCLAFPISRLIRRKDSISGFGILQQDIQPGEKL